MADEIPSKLKRDTALERRMLDALLQEQKEHPRSQQKLAGPSQLGGCRELLRTTLFEPDFEGVPETEWATAAWMGTTAGAALEEVFGRRLSALEQTRITTHLQRLGVDISGAMDLVFLDDEQITDLKSTDSMGGVLYDFGKNAELIESLVAIHQDGTLFQRHIETPDGGYELTKVLLEKISKLHYYCQIAIYVVGAIQAGILPASAEGRIVFYDRSGASQEFVAIVVDAAEIAAFYEIAQHRLEQVMVAQELLERSGNPALIHELRDMRPSYCFSKKVQCPVRERCWGGSSWMPDEIVTDADKVAAAERYDEGRRLEALGKGMKASAREELVDVAGRMPNGMVVGWSGNGRTISVVRSSEPMTPEAVAAAFGFGKAAESPEPANLIPNPSPQPPAEGAENAFEPWVGAYDEAPAESEFVKLVEPEMQAADAAQVQGLMQKVAEARAARARIALEVQVVMEAEERAQYGGRSFPEHLAYLALSDQERRSMLHTRNERLAELQRKAIAEAGLA